MESIEPTSSGKKSNRTLWIILGIVAAVACLCLISVAVIGYLVFYIQPNQTVEQLLPLPTVIVTEQVVIAPQLVEPQQVSYNNPDDNTLGDPDAPLTLTVYSDLQCPFCKRFHQQTLPQIIRNYVDTGQVRLEYRTMGDFLGPESALAGQAAYCAGDQDAFWPFLDYVFANQSGENQGVFTVDFMVSIAEALDLNTSRFESCLTTGRYEDRVMQDYADGVDAGVRGTPTSVLSDGTLIEGAQPYDTFVQILDAALGK